MSEEMWLSADCIVTTPVTPTEKVGVLQEYIVYYITLLKKIKTMWCDSSTDVDFNETLIGEVCQLGGGSMLHSLINKLKPMISWPVYIYEFVNPVSKQHLTVQNHVDEVWCSWNSVSSCRRIQTEQKS